MQTHLDIETVNDQNRGEKKPTPFGPGFPQFAPNRIHNWDRENESKRTEKQKHREGFFEKNYIGNRKHDTQPGQ